PDIASEWIYRNPVLDEDTLVIGISQSGETRDTIQAMQLARSLGARTVAVTNQMGSQITREVDSVLLTRTGLEVGVAASKTFSAQIALIYLIGLELARQRGTLPAGEIEFILDQVWKLPSKMQVFLDGDHPVEAIQHIANDVIYVPKSPTFLQAVLATLPLQLLAYRIARLRGLNVDQPRNLAKTVTVE